MGRKLTVDEGGFAGCAAAADERPWPVPTLQDSSLGAGKAFGLGSRSYSAMDLQHVTTVCESSKN